MKHLRKLSQKHLDRLYLFLVGLLISVFVYAIFLNQIWLSFFVVLSILLVGFIWKNSQLSPSATTNDLLLHYDLLESSNLTFSWEVDQEFNLKYVSSNLSAIMGYESLNQVSKQNYLSFLASEDKLSFQNLLRETTEKNIGFVGTYTHIKKDKSNIWVYMRVSAMFNNQKEIVGYIGLTQDISTTKDLDFAIKQNQQRYKTIIEVSNTGAWEFDTKKNPAWFSPGYFEMLGYDPKDNRFKNGDIQTCWVDLVHPKDVDKALANIKTYVESNTEAIYVNKFRFKRADGSYAWIESRGKRLKDDTNQMTSFMVGTHIDYSFYKESEEKILFYSYKDQLTNLYNRRYFEEKLVEFDQPHFYPLSIVMADVNGLKFFNDVFGHAVGDQLLIEIADVLKLSNKDNYVLARVGGDEFLMIMPNTDQSEVANMIEVIKEQLNGHTILGLPVTISLGSQTKYDQETSLEKVLKDADDFMYNQKITEQTENRFKMVQMCRKQLFQHDSSQIDQSRNVSLVSKKIATHMGFNHQQIKALLLSAYYHNIGKICFVLGNPHVDIPYSQFSANILYSLQDYNTNATDVLYHLENFDGSGTPKHLKAEQIPLSSRIIRVALDFIGLTTLYNQATLKQKQKAISMMKTKTNITYDPKIIDALSQLVDRLEV